MGSRRHKRASEADRLQLVMANVAWGALAGAVIAGIALVVGVVGTILALLSGKTMEALSWSDARMLAFYVGSFALAGAVVGALRTLLHGTAGTYAAMALGGVIVTCCIAVADAGMTSMTRGKWIGMIVMGVIFGCAGAYGLVRGQRIADRP